MLFFSLSLLVNCSQLLEKCFLVTNFGLFSFHNIYSCKLRETGCLFRKTCLVLSINSFHDAHWFKNSKPVTDFRSVNFCTQFFRPTHFYLRALVYTKIDLLQICRNHYLFVGIVRGVSCLKHCISVKFAQKDRWTDIQADTPQNNQFAGV